jgi:hypothetical protein
LAFKDYEHIGNTLDLISDMGFIYSLEKTIVDYYRKLPNKLIEMITEAVRYLEAIGIVIMYRVERSEEYTKLE